YWCVEAIDHEGAKQWTDELVRLDAEGFDPIVAVAANGTVVTAARGFDLTYADKPDVLALALSPEGEIRWKLDTTTKDLLASGVAVDPSGAVLIEGGGAATADV